MGDWPEKLRILAQKSLKKAISFVGQEHSSRSRVIIFLCALCIGVFTKAVLNDFITIGHDDYKLARPEGIVDLNLLEKTMIRKGSTGNDTRSVPKGESCAEGGA